MARGRSRSPVRAGQSAWNALIAGLQNGIALHSNNALPSHAPRKNTEQLDLESHGLSDTGEEDQIELVDHILLEECHRLGALAELRVAFNTAWKENFHCKAAPEVFPAWFFSALNAEVPAWAPLPGCELRGKTTDKLKAPSLACILLYMPGKKAIDPGYRGLVKTPAVREAAAVKFAETAIELATEIREEWMWRYQLIIRDSRSDPLRIAAEFSAAGAEERSVELKLLGTLPRYLRSGRFKEIFNIHASYAKKLFSRFKQRNAGLLGVGPFTARCWQLLARYQIVFGYDGKLSGWHSAVTPKVMASLVQDFGVCHELFASPLNCVLPGYCSMFEDIDKFFGSSGSFFQYCRPDGPLVTNGGSYECNPPFCDELFQAVVPLLLQALTLCKEPLSIVLVLPFWKWSSAVIAASTSYFCRGRVDISGSDHAYMNGLQHRCKLKDRIWRSDPRNKGIGWDSVVLLMQNDAWAYRFPISVDTLVRHRASWGQI